MEGNELTNIVISREEIRNKLNKLRSDKAPGVDGILPRFLREITDELVEPLAMLFARSMETGEIPSDLRAANVTPIHKKGSRSKVENYRPVSLTSQISKLMESLIRDAIEKHLENNFLIRESQHGFRKGQRTFVFD